MAELEAEELSDLRKEFAESWRETAPDTADLFRGTTDVENPSAPDEVTKADALLLAGIPFRYKTSKRMAALSLLAEKPSGTEFLECECPAWDDVGQATIEVRVNDIFRVYAKGDDPTFDIKVLSVTSKSNAMTRRFTGQQR